MCEEFRQDANPTERRKIQLENHITLRNNCYSRLREFSEEKWIKTSSDAMDALHVPDLVNRLDYMGHRTVVQNQTCSITDLDHPIDVFDETYGLARAKNTYDHFFIMFFQ